MIPSHDPAENLKNGIWADTNGYDPSAFSSPGKPAATTERYSRIPETPIALPPTLEQVRQEKTTQAQTLIDSIRSSFNKTLSDEVAAGGVRSARTRASNLTAGLGGSDFGAAAAQNTEDRNKSAQKMIENERDTKIAAVLSGIEDRATEDFTKLRDQYNQETEASLSRRKKYQDAAAADVKTLASSGLSLDRFQGSDVYQKLLDQTGMAPLELDAMFNAGAPKKAAKDIHYEKLGNDKIVAFWTGDDGTLQRKEYDFQVPADMKLHVISGVPYYEDPTTHTLSPAKGFQPKPEDGGGGGGGGLGGEDPQLYNGLSSKTATAIRAKVGQFKAEPIIQNFATIQEGRNLASSIPDNTKNPADDQALIYSLAKALDPGSVVREGEYATAQKYSQSWIKAYGKGVEQAALGTGFLSEEARRNIKKTIQTKFESSKKSYDNLYGQYQEGINNLTGRKDGAKFVQDYQVKSDPNAELESDIKAGQSHGDTREVMIEKLTKAYPELTPQQIHEKVYALIPDQK